MFKAEIEVPNIQNSLHPATELYKKLCTNFRNLQFIEMNVINTYIYDLRQTDRQRDLQSGS